MFRRARLRLTLVYIALMGVTLAVVGGGILLLGAQQAQQTQDQSLRLRAEDLSGRATRTGRRSSAPGDADGDDEARRRRDRLEGEGILQYELGVRTGRVVEQPPDTYAGLPSAAAAQAALDAGAPQFQTLSLDDGDVRVYSLPISRDGQPVAVVQVARSRYFVDETVTRLLLIVIGAGAAGLLFSAASGFWLAGRALRPIATALQRQRDFTADASHELRTPLAVVRGNAELLLRHPEARIDAYDDVVRDIVDESERLGRLVADLLTLARADSGGIQVARERVDLSDVGAELLRAMTPLAAAKGLTLRGEIAPGVAVTGDPDRLRQLGMILLDNAIRYTEAGEITLRVAREGQGATLAVQDTGPGIAAEHLPRLFDRFYRADAARTADGGGSGLGLAIARWVADAHGGRLTVTSAPGRGSTFAVHLPRSDPSTARARQPEGDTAVRPAVPGPTGDGAPAP